MILIVFTTAPNNEEAETLARKIIKAKLAACVQVLPPMKSFYVWENELQTDSENLLLIKTLAKNYGELEKFIQTNHSYEVPEIVAVNAENVSDNYFKWLTSVIG